MKTLAAVVLFFLLPALAAQGEPTEEEIKRHTASTLEQCDMDGNAKIELDELQEKLEAFYVDFAKADKSEEKQNTVRDGYPGLLTLQLFLAADLDDDNAIAEPDLKWLFAHPNDDQWTLTDSMWTLGDADVDLLVQDFILRIRKGATSHPHDRLRKTTGKGKNKAEKLADRAEPYRQMVIKKVLAARARSVLHRSYSTDELSKLFDKLGRVWTLGEGADDDMFDATGEVVTAEDAAERGDGLSRAGVHNYFAVGHKYEVSTLDKSYSVAAEIKKTKLTVKAGTFDCDFYEVACHGCTLKIWQHSMYPLLPIKSEMTVGDEVTIHQLKAFKE
jgi:hypothetical protein